MRAALRCLVAVAALAAAGCKHAPAEPAVVPPSASGSGAGSGAENAQPTQRVAPHSHDRFEGFENPVDAVAYAIFRARYETATNVARKVGTPLSQATPKIPEGSRRVRLTVSSNVHGELEDCGCKHNPLGGFARRATIVAREVTKPTPVATFQFDAGDALFRRAPSPVEGVAAPAGSDDELIAARTLAESYARLGVDGMTLGPYDVLRGGTTAVDLLRRAGVGAVSANLLRDGKPILPRSRVVERHGIRLGVVGVAANNADAAARFHAAGLTVAPPLAAATQEIQRLRTQSLTGVVLLAATGVQAATELVRDLAAAGAAPDLVLVSGSSQVLNEAAWVAGVPIVEAGDRGKMLATLDAYLVGERIAFRPAGGQLLDVVRQYQTVLRLNNNAEADRIAGAEGSGAAGERARNLRRRQVTRLRELERELLNAAQAGSGDTTTNRDVLAVQMVPVTLTTAEEPGIKKLVDGAKARMAAPPGGAP